MGRNAKCKCCGKKLITTEAFYIVKNNKREYYCSEKEFDEYIRNKNKEKYGWNELCDFVKIDVLGYDSVQQLPKFLIQRLQDIRNGTTTEPEVGRVVRYKEGYEYEIILETFKECLEDIKFWAGKKSFKTERSRINYIMTIIENHIGEIYEKKKCENQRLDKVINQQFKDLDVINMDYKPVELKKNNTPKKVNLMDLLDEDDLD